MSNLKVKIENFVGTSYNPFEGNEFTFLSTDSGATKTWNR